MEINILIIQHGPAGPNQWRPYGFSWSTVCADHHHKLSHARNRSKIRKQLRRTVPPGGRTPCNQTDGISFSVPRASNRCALVCFRRVQTGRKCIKMKLHYKSTEANKLKRPNLTYSEQSEPPRSNGPASNGLAWHGLKATQGKVSRSRRGRSQKRKESDVKEHPRRFRSGL